MQHPSPYTLLRAANGFKTPAATDPPGPSWTDPHTLAARWQDLQQPPPSVAASAPADSGAPPAPIPADGPPMRTPAPMHPPIAYPTSTQIYDASAPSPKSRHAHYDAIIEQHKNAAEKAVYVPATLE